MTFRSAFDAKSDSDEFSGYTSYLNKKKKKRTRKGTLLHYHYTKPVTIAIFCIVFKIKRDFGQKSRFISYPVLHDNPLGKNGCVCFLAISFTIKPDPWPVRRCKQILQKLFCLLEACVRYRRTDGQRNRRKCDLNS